ncbi:MAG: sensor histidine kinase [Clostridia bacterium]|nr:sensor histidine kinase [Clostridia bacterium]
MKNRKSKSIRSQIFLYFMLSTSLLLVVIGIVLYYNFSSLIKNEVTTSTQMIIDKSGSQLDMYIENVKGLSMTLADNNNTCTLFNNSHEVINFEEDRDDLQSLINTIIAGNQDIESIIMVGHDGLIISNETNLSMEISKDMMETSWYKDAIGNTMPVLTSARMQEFSMDKDTWVISLSREIVGTCDENLGVLLIDINYDVIEGILDDLNLGKHGYAFIINSNNDIVYHKDFSYFQDETKKEELLTIRDNASMFVHEYKFENANWTLVGVASMDSLYMFQKDIIMAIVILGIFMFLISLGSSVFFSKRVTNPLKKLEKAMAQVDSGNLNQDVNVTGSSEAESLAEYYRSMMIKIKKLLTEIKEKEMVLRNSELQVLYSQINPHFLYNTLDTILWAAEFQDNEKVINLTKALASFFRLSLKGGSELTTIESEFEHIRQYLYIQKQRYQDKLEYEITMDEAIKDIEIPKLILQPIVENAIYHGIKELDEVGIIKISARKSDHDIFFEITDNGVGYDVNKEVINAASSLKLGGVGQSNVDRRLKLYYGESCGLYIESKLNEGTTVTIKISDKMK